MSGREGGALDPWCPPPPAPPPPHHEEQAALLLQGPQAAQEARHHGDAPRHQEEVGGRERREGQRQRGEVGLGEGEPHPHAKKATPTQLQAGWESFHIQRWHDNNHCVSISPQTLTQKTRLKANIRYLTHISPPDSAAMAGHERWLHSVTRGREKTVDQGRGE